MQQKLKKSTLILFACLSVAFFGCLTLILVITGKIDLLGLPFLKPAVNLLNSESENLAFLNKAVAQNVIPAEKYTSITDIVAADGAIYAADKTGMKLYKIADGSVTATYKADKQLNGVCVSGNTVYALAGGAEGEVIVLNTNLVKSSVIAVGHTPTAMVVNGNTAYVANRFNNNISVIDLTSNKITSNIEIEGREVIALTLANGKLYAACHLPEDASNESVVSANVAVINTANNTVIKTIELVNGAGGVKDITASPDGNSVYVSHVIARYTYPTTQLDRGWINTNGFSKIDTTLDTATAFMLDEVELGAANPWGIDVSDDGKTLAVALSGTDEVMLIDIAALNEKVSAVKIGNGLTESSDKIVDYLPFLDGCRTRVKLNGKGARALTFIGNKLYIGQYFTADIAVVDTLAKKQTSTVTVADQPENDVVRQGEILFSDANLCYQKWQSCLSCHPDALADGFNWDNMNDGLGNPKSAKSLLYSHRTPPVMVTGIRDTAETAVRAGMKFIQFNVIDEEKLDCIDKYLLSLMPEQSPYLNTDGTLTESAKRGKELFESAGCVTCHPAPLYTDLKTHNVGTTENDDGNWENRSLDTPTLAEVWRTGAWLHDGRYNNMADVVRYFAPDLSDSEINDLASFILSIGKENEQYGVEQVFIKNGDKTTISSLVPNGNIIGFTLRCQQRNAEAAKITATLKDSDGNTIKSVTKTIDSLKYNTSCAVVLGDGFNIPQNAKGVKLQIRIKNSSDEDIASPYTLTY